jgi:predicted GNAT family N-acyltransferase
MEVRPLHAIAELRAVARLRYERFVEERQCRLPHADDENRLLLEPLDGSALLLGGYAQGELVGSARLHFGLPAEYRRLYRLAECPAEHRQRVSVTSRLVVSGRAPSLGRGALRLAEACFAEAAPRGAWLNFIDCNAPLRSFFHALGFVELGGGPVAHEVFGEIFPMVVVLPGLERFRRLRSPFHAQAARAGLGGGELPAALRLLRLLAPATDLAPWTADAPAAGGSGETRGERRRPSRRERASAAAGPPASPPVTAAAAAPSSPSRAAG